MMSHAVPQRTMMHHYVPQCAIMYQDVPRFTMMCHDLWWCTMMYHVPCIEMYHAFGRTSAPPPTPNGQYKKHFGAMHTWFSSKKTSPILFETARIHLLQSFNFCSKQKLPHESSNVFGAAVSCLQTSAFSDERADFMQRQGARYGTVWETAAAWMEGSCL